LRLSFVVLLWCAAKAQGQTEPRQLLPMLEEQIQTADVSAYQLRRHVLKKVPKLVPTASAGQWNLASRKGPRTLACSATW
jgi:hypothetical protein